MENKINTSILLILCTLGLLISSCYKQGKKDKPVEPDNPNGEMEDPESILDDFDFKPTDPIDYSDKAYYYKDHINILISFLFRKL